MCFGPDALRPHWHFLGRDIFSLKICQYFWSLSTCLDDTPFTTYCKSQGFCLNTEHKGSNCHLWQKRNINNKSKPSTNSQSLLNVLVIDPVCFESIKTHFRKSDWNKESHYPLHWNVYKSFWVNLKLNPHQIQQQF